MNAFEGMVGDLEYPMFIVTARAGDEPLGCLVGFTTQASIDPPRFIACLSHNNRTYRRGRDATALGVHAVPADAEDLAELFGGETGDQTDKFARCDVARRARAASRSSTAARTGSSAACWRASTRATTTRSCSSRSPAHRATGRVHVPPRQADRSRSRGLTLTVGCLTRAFDTRAKGGVGSRTMRHMGELWRRARAG